MAKKRVKTKSGAKKRTSPARKKYLMGLGSLPSVTQKSNTGKQKAILIATHLVSGIGGAVAGEFLGRYGFLAGAATIGTGVFLGETHLITAGAGMFTGVSSVAKTEAGTSGLGEYDFKKELEDGKERATNFFKVGMKKAVFADQFMKDEAQAALPENSGAAGLGEWYFPEAENSSDQVPIPLSSQLI